MTSQKLTTAALVFGTAVFLTACSHTASYNAAHFEYSPQAFEQKIDGIAAIEMNKQEQAETYTGNPTSFTGSATTLTLPIGQILREGAVLAFRDMFSEGAEVIEQSNGRAYTAIIKPSVRSFSYEYNQLKNIGFAITPTATVALEVKMANEEGEVIWERTVDSGPVEGPAYMITGAPGEEISKVAHKAVLRTMQQAASQAYEDVRDQVTKQAKEEAL